MEEPVYLKNMIPILERLRALQHEIDMEIIRRLNGQLAPNPSDESAGGKE